MTKKIKKQENKQTTGRLDNKMLRILVYLKNQGTDGDQKSAIMTALPKMTNNDQITKILDKTIALGWIKSKIERAGKHGKDFTVYFITPEGKKALEEIQDLVSKSIYLSKLDAFDEVFETKHQKSFEN